MRQQIKDILAEGASGEMITVNGWIRSKRLSKKRAFITLTDGSCHLGLQGVIEAHEAVFGQLDEVVTGTAVAVTGTLVDSPAHGQSKEIVVRQLAVLGRAGDDYPLQKKNHSLEFLREIAHLRPRSQTIAAVLRVRHVLAMATHEYFDQQGLKWVHTPIITTSDSEGAGDMFTVTHFDLMKPLPQTQTGQVDFKRDFFGEQAYLSVTGQLQAEYLAMGLGGVYSFGPTFRAENSHTRRHLAEFWMIEPEVAFAQLDDCMALATGHVQFMLRKVLAECGDELEFFADKNPQFDPKTLENMASTPQFARITYSEALQILAKAEVELAPLQWGDSIPAEHERYLSEIKYQGAVFVTDYPKDCKAFYMRLNSDQTTVACFDLLVPKCGELIGGSQREERYNELAAAMAHHGIADELAWYLDLRRHGSVVHSGYGLGLERMVLLCTGVDNVRDTIPSPRTPGQAGF